MVTATNLDPIPTAPPIRVTSPNTGELIGEAPDRSPAEVHAAVERARAASRRWGAMTHAQRRAELQSFRKGLAHEAGALAELVHLETGKPRVDAIAEVMLAVQHVHHALERAEAVLSPRVVSSGLMANFKSTISFHPLGVIAVIGPWNYPIYTPMGSIAYALAAGNAVVFKPSELTPLVAIRVGEIAARTMSTPGLLEVVSGRGATGAALCRAAVDKIAFTGSTATGRKVMIAAAERLTPVLLELGGKDPMIVQADADLDKAAESAVFGAMTNAGQACVSIERCYVAAPVYERFVDKVVAEAQALKVGGAPDAHIGHITMPAQVDIIRRHLEDAVDKGAKVLVGGHLRIEGNRVPPTVLVDVTEDMLIMKEETFGPVLPIMKVRDTEEALRLANDSRYGLGSAVFGKAGVRELAERIVSGMTTINAVIAFGAIPTLPFGGVGESGFGRIHGDRGLEEFARTKAITEKRFALPLDLLSFKLPPQTYDQLRGMVTKLYGGPILDAAAAGKRLVGKLLGRG
ncbi:MAG: aldehyde dehydrogenase family protein [Deltaproteobacteria bacterium]|nr:aldehyde dehydrogenase family protein [Deltaproteobacteria bacterium]